MGEAEAAERAAAQALSRSPAAQRRRANLYTLAVVLAGAPALYAVHLVLKQSYYLAMAAQIAVPLGLHAWLSRKGAAGVFLSWMWSAIGSCLMVMGYFGYAVLVDRATNVAASTIVAAILFAAVAVHRPEMVAKGQRGIASLVYCFLAVYSYCGMFEINCLLDRSAVALHRPVVFRKVYGARGARALLVDPWSPAQRLNPASLLIQPRTVTVPMAPELFQQVHAGDSICVLQKSGRLRMPWYVAELRSWHGERIKLGAWGKAF